MEATKFNALGIASTKDMTSCKIGAKMCSVTFRAKTNVPRSFPVTRTNTKGKNNCIISNQRQSNLSNHQRNDCYCAQYGGGGANPKNVLKKFSCAPLGGCKSTFFVLRHICH